MIIQNAAKGRHQARDVGNKAFQLLRLKRRGFATPGFIVIDTSEFEEVCRPLCERIGAALRRITDETGIPALTRSLQDDLASIAVGPELGSRLSMTIASRFKSRELIFRSSATMEDGAAQSFAGVFDSVRGSQSAAISDTVLSVWRSGFSERALTYFYANSLPFEQLSMAVIVQEYVPGDLSGIVFTLDPSDFDANNAVISYIEGAGAGLVSGEQSGKTITVSRDTFDAVGGDGDSAVPSVVHRALGQAIRIERMARGIPQDIEWTSAGDELYVLQARPVSTWKRWIEDRVIWDNSNLVESYYGATTPLTFSFARKNYALVYREFYRAMGASKASIRARGEMFENMIGFHRNNIYYNLNNWYGTLILLPGFKHNARYMESMMGVKKRLNLQSIREQEFALRHRLLFVPSVVFLLFKLVLNATLLPRRIRRFLAIFDELEIEFLRMDIDTLDLGEAVALYRQRDAMLTKLWRIPVMNDLYTMFDYGKITRFFDERLPDQKSLLGEALRSERVMKGCEPALELKRIVEWIGADPDVSEFFQRNSRDEIYAQLTEEPSAWPELREALEDYIVEYGSRCVGDMKLEVSSLLDEPERLIDHIKHYLDSDLMPHFADVGDSTFPEQIRPLRRRIARLQRRLAQREELRLKRSKVFRATRMIFLRIADHMVAADLISERDQIFFLTEDEVFEAVEGRRNTADFNSLTLQRRREYESNLAFVPPNRFVTNRSDFHTSVRVEDDRESDTPHPSDGAAESTAINEKTGHDQDAKDSTLHERRGDGCSAGVAEGRVVAYRPDIGLEEVKDAILVTFRTDPGFVSFFLSIRGLLVETGSMLSHSAIVARELGIPTIMNIPNLTEWLKSGDQIKMDASSGLVTRDPEGGS